MSERTARWSQVQDYYGRVLQASGDLKTDACCCAGGMVGYLRPILEMIHPEVTERFYGCGSPIPLAIEGYTVLDLGCGTGRDTLICAKLVGPTGRVIGVDMTEAQLAVARRHAPQQAETFGYAKSNTTFLHGYMEDLAAVGLEDDSVDVVISNCVINLSPDKPQVFSEILRVLRPGGELLFSDVFADRRIPTAALDDSVLVGECLAGAMYLEDFRRILAKLGVPDYRVVQERPISLNHPETEGKLGGARFSSVTVRAFKLDSLEDRCEDYGQVARYLGTIDGAPDSFVLDTSHEFPAGKPTPVCGNTTAILQGSRLARHFRVDGDRSVHYGAFPDERTRGAAERDTSTEADCCARSGL